MEEDPPQEAQGEPTLNSLVLREGQELLRYFEPGRLRDADAGVSTKPSLTPELAGGAQAKEQGVEANEPMAPTSPSRAKSMNSENPVMWRPLSTVFGGSSGLVPQSARPMRTLPRPWPRNGPEYDHESRQDLAI